METSRRHAEELLDLTRILLLVQGAILIAATLEGLIWGVIFAGAAGLPFLLSGAAAVTLFAARARMQLRSTRARRLVYGVEGFTLAGLAIDTALALAITGGYPPPVALMTRLALPLAVVLLLRRAARMPDAPTSTQTVRRVEATT